MTVYQADATLILTDGTELPGRVGLLHYPNSTQEAPVWGGQFGFAAVPDPTVLGAVAGWRQMRIGDQQVEVDIKRPQKGTAEVIGMGAPPDGLS